MSRSIQRTHNFDPGRVCLYTMFFHHKTLFLEIYEKLKFDTYVPELVESSLYEICNDSVLTNCRQYGTIIFVKQILFCHIKCILKEIFHMTSRCQHNLRIEHVIGIGFDIQRNRTTNRNKLIKIARDEESDIREINKLRQNCYCSINLN